MAELVPVPFPVLLRRAHHEFVRRREIFDLPARKFYRGGGAYLRPGGGEASALDLSVRYAGSRAANPVGPAAGPHTQLAQNLALCWLAGARILELKTVQINDRLSLSRPCIDMATIGYNTEWSQELRLADSLQEYVKASMLIEALEAWDVLGTRQEGSSPLASLGAEAWAEAARPPGRRSLGEGGSPLAPRLAPAESGFVFDVSVGYDLAGIRSPAMVNWLETIRGAAVVVDDLRAEIPIEFAPLRDLPYRTAISTSVTLSTFHGTPADEIERIGEFLIGELGFHTVIKLNPPMLGRETVDHILHDVLGYHDVDVNPGCYERNLGFDDAVAVVRRLQGLARRRGVEVGIKCGNTLEVLNRGTFLKEPVQYLSGQPLHALHAELVRRWREVFGASLQISFSAGIDAHNVADAVAAGLVPVTTCTDLLRAGGYGRLSRYLTNLEGRMRERGARTIDEFIERTAAAASGGPGTGPVPAPSADADGPRTPRHAASGRAVTAHAGIPAADRCAAAVIANTRALAERALTDPRYRADQNRKAPRKLGTHLWLWDCVSCSKCVPACPNDAVFELDAEPFAGAVPVLEVDADGWRETERRLYRAMKPTQIAIFADGCNECGNCDVFCPEDGGPYIEKPRLHGSVESWSQSAPHMGFVLTLEDGRFVLRGRLAAREYRLTRESDAETAVFETEDARVVLGWHSNDVLEATPIPPVLSERASPARVEGPLASRLSPAPCVIDLSPYMTLRLLMDALLRASRVHFVNAPFLESRRG